MKQCSFSTNFRIAEPFNLDYVIHFYILNTGLSSPVFPINILVVEYLVAVRQVIKELPGNLSPGNLSCAYEYATIPSVNNVIKST